MRVNQEYKGKGKILCDDLPPELEFRQKMCPQCSQASGAGGR